MITYRTYLTLLGAVGATACATSPSPGALAGRWAGPNTTLVASATRVTLALPCATITFPTRGYQASPFTLAGTYFDGLATHAAHLTGRITADTLDATIMVDSAFAPAGQSVALYRDATFPPTLGYCPANSPGSAS